MKSINQVMNNIQTEIFKTSPHSDIVCKGCGESVREIEILIPVGPLKGQKTIGKVGCKCEDLRIAREVVQEIEKAKRKKLFKRFDVDSLMNPILKGATFDSYNPTNMELVVAKQRGMDYVSVFEKDKPINILFTGPFGTGKSHLSVSICKGLMERGFSTIFISVPKLLTEIKYTYSPESEVSERELIRALTEVDLLVLDDIGAEKDSEWAMEKMFEIIDGRQGKSTLYTTNYDTYDLKKRIGQRIFTRLIFKTTVIKMDGEDYRESN